MICQFIASLIIAFAVIGAAFAGAAIVWIAGFVIHHLFRIFTGRI